MEQNAPQPQDMSASIAKLATALAAAQGQIKAAEKDRTNPHFKRDYATLASVWDACRGPLSSQGLAVIQTTRNGSDGKTVTVVTTLAHSSGEWVRGEITMIASPATPQGIGSCLTYARRYGLAAIVGVAPAEEDDDGNGASEPHPAPAARKHEISQRTYEGTGGHFRFGKAKGKALAEGTDRDLSWYCDAIRENVADPAKAQYRDDNEKHLASVEAEISRRAAQAAGEADGPPPQDDADAPATDDVSVLETWRSAFVAAAKRDRSSLSLEFRKMDLEVKDPTVKAQLKVDYQKLVDKLDEKRMAGAR